ncbi:MAG: hypothetical protein MI863_02485 [Desulfobacterales bacterium]|nr:hypothetical protein [Desulfobacterales bacterium]
MKLGIYQNHPEFGNKDRNIDHAVTALHNTGADIIILPELFATGYQFTSREEAVSLSEKIPDGKTCCILSELAASQKIFLVFGIIEKDDDKIYNSAALIGPDGFIGKYRKTHLFAEEKFWFSPGDTGLNVFDIGIARLGIMICFDWWFPESARSLALMGADIICHPSNLVFHNCQKAMVTRSLENGVFSATANRIGTEERGGKAPLIFTGGSQILDNKGNVLTSMDAKKTGVSIADIDVKAARNKKITEQNDRFEDRRPEYYKALFD